MLYILLIAAGMATGYLAAYYTLKEKRQSDFPFRVFEQRINAHEGLYKILLSYQALFQDIISAPEHSPEQRYQLMREAYGDLSGYYMTHSFYFGEDLGPEFLGFMVNVQDIHHLDDEIERTEEEETFWANYQAALKLIRKESGIDGVTDLIKNAYTARDKKDLLDQFEKMENRFN